MDNQETFGHSFTPRDDVPAADTILIDNATAPDAISEAEALDALKVLEERRKERKRKLIIKVAVTAVVAALIAVGIYFLVQQNNNKEQDLGPQMETEVVVREDYSVPIEGNGTLQAIKSASVSPEVEGTINEVFVQEGVHVEKGDRLFTIDSPDVESAIEEASDKIAEAEQGVSQANAAISSAQSAYKKASSAYKKAKKKYDKAKKAYDKDKAAADEAKKEQKAAGDEAYQKAYDAAIADKPDNKNAATSAGEAARKAAEASIKIPSVSSANVDKYAEALEDAEVKLDTAQGNLDTAKEDLTTAQGEVTSAQKDYDNAVKEREKCTVVAPESGTLVEFSAKEGETTSSGEGSADSLARIADLSGMKMSIEVSESEISKIEKNQHGTIVPSAFPDLELDAKVTGIASSATGDEDNAAFDGGSVTFKVEMEVEKPDGRLKPGMSASAQILTQELKDVLVIPSSALSEEEDGTYVEVVVNEETMETEMRKVTVKTQDSSRAVIKKGLTEGEVVVVTRFDLADEDGEESVDAAGVDEGKEVDLAEDDADVELDDEIEAELDEEE